MKTMTGKQLGEKLLRSVRQMRRGEAVRTTRAKPNAAAKAHADVGLSQAQFAALLGVSTRTLQDWSKDGVSPPEPRVRCCGWHRRTPRCCAS